MTRKDRFSQNIVAMQQWFGLEEFSVCPETFVLPDELADFYNAFSQTKEEINRDV